MTNPIQHTVFSIEHDDPQLLVKIITKGVREAVGKEGLERMSDGAIKAGSRLGVFVALNMFLTMTALATLPEKERQASLANIRKGFEDAGFTSFDSRAESYEAEEKAPAEPKAEPKADKPPIPREVIEAAVAIGAAKLAATRHTDPSLAGAKRIAAGVPDGNLIATISRKTMERDFGDEIPEQVQAVMDHRFQHGAYMAWVFVQDLLEKSDTDPKYSRRLHELLTREFQAMPFQDRVGMVKIMTGDEILKEAGLNGN